MLPKYYRHLKKHGFSLLTTLYGLHVVRPIGGIKVKISVTLISYRFEKLTPEKRIYIYIYKVKFLLGIKTRPKITNLQFQNPLSNVSCLLYFPLLL